MILPAVFERFTERSPLSVMAQGAIEYALSESALNQVFDSSAEGQYTRELEDFLEAHVHDVRQHAALCSPRPLPGGPRQLEDVGLGDQRLVGRPEALLEPLRLLLGDLQAVHDVVGDMTARKHRARGVPDLTGVKDRDEI